MTDAAFIGDGKCNLAPLKEKVQKLGIKEPGKHPQDKNIVIVCSYQRKVKRKILDKFIFSIIDNIEKYSSIQYSNHDFNSGGSLDIYMCRTLPSKTIYHRTYNYRLWLI